MRRKLVISLLLVAAAIGLFLTLQHLDQGTLSQPISSTATPRYTLIDAEWTRYDSDGTPSLLGKASRIIYFDDQSGIADDLVVDALGVGGAPWRLTSPHANLPAAQRKFELQGPVVITGNWPDNGESVIAHTDQLWVDPDERQFSTEAPVRWDSATRFGSSVGLHGDWHYHTLQLLHSVNMTYRAPANESK